MPLLVEAVAVEADPEADPDALGVEDGPASGLLDDDAPFCCCCCFVAHSGLGEKLPSSDDILGRAPRRFDGEWQWFRVRANQSKSAKARALEPPLLDR